MTINRKNYRNARRRSYCYHANVERWRKNKYTIDFDAWTYESEINLALMVFRLRKYIQFIQKRLNRSRCRLG